MGNICCSDETLTSAPARQTGLKPRISTGTSKPELFYFYEIHGKVEPIRMLLHQAGVDYDFKSFSFPAFAVWKQLGMSKSGQVPLYVDENGKYCNQSNAILRKLGRQHGYYFSDDAEETFLVDWVLETILDFDGTKSYQRWMADESDCD